jgi:Flp pilus assembly protein TadD
MTARGLPVSGASPEVVDAINDFVARLVRIDQGSEAILTAAERWPDVPMVRLCAAAFFLFGQTGDALRTASAHLDAVEGGNERERAYHAALRLWQANDNLRAVEAWEAITTRWPEDLMAAKCAEFLYYVLGQQHMGARFRAHMERIEPFHANDPDFLSMAAFASELCGDFADAERRATRSLEIEARNPWAQHALSHVLIRQGRVEEGMQKLVAFLPQLATCARPIHSHDAWHLALLHLEELDVPRTMEVFHGHIWGISPDYVVEQLDAIALLWRIELSGTPMDAEWQSIADHVTPRATETFMPFMNAHYIYALARAGRMDAVEAALEAVQGRSMASDAEAKRVWARAGRAVIEGCARFASGDRAGAAEILEPVMPDMTCIGGSDAQDDLFRQTYLRSLQAAGRKADAASYFERISGDKRLTPLDHTLAA